MSWCYETTGMQLPPFSLRGSVSIADQRLAMLSLLGQMVIIAYGLVAILVNASYFDYLPVTPISQGGHVEASLAYDGNTACGAVYATHCAGGRMCTELAPDQLLVPSGTVFQDELYVTTRIDLVTREVVCTGEILRGLCVGTVAETELERLRVALTNSISELIAARRTKIKELWERMEMGEVRPQQSATSARAQFRTRAPQ